MFKTKKQLKEKIKQLICDIELLEISKDIAVNQLKIADGEIRNARTVANFWKTRFENVEKIIKENEELKKEIKNLKEALEKEKICYSVISTHNDELYKENEKLTTQTNIKDNYIKRLEKEVLKQKQTIKDKDEYIAFLRGNFNLNIRTTLQNSQFKDKLNRISAILNED